MGTFTAVTSCPGSILHSFSVFHCDPARIQVYNYARSHFVAQKLILYRVSGVPGIINFYRSFSPRIIEHSRHVKEAGVYCSAVGLTMIYTLQETHSCY